MQRAFNAFSRETERALAERIAAQAAALTAAAPSSLAVQLVSIPILHGTGLTVSAKLEASGAQWLENLRATPGVLLIEEGQALSIIDAVGQEAIQISAEQSRAGVDLW